MKKKLMLILVSMIVGLISTIAFISLYQEFSTTSWKVITLGYIGFTVLTLLMIVSYKRRRNEYHVFIKKPIIAIFVAVFSFLLFFSLKNTNQYLDAYPWLFKAFVYSMSYLLIFIGVTWLLYLLVHTSLQVKIREVSRWRILLYAIPAILVWSVYLVAYFPGTMTPDSFSHWEQIHTLDFSNWHPVIYTWYILGLTSLWKSPAIVAFSQIVVIAIISGYMVYSLEKRGIPHKWLWPGMILFALFPLNGIFAIAMWKDIFFSAFIFLFTIIVYNIVSTKGRWLSSNGHLIIFSLTVLGVSFMRSNGLPIFIVMAILMMIAYRKYLKRLIITVGIVGIVYFVVTGPFYNYMEVSPTSPNEALGIPTQQIARVIVEDGGDLTEEQRTYLNKILPLEKWEEKYNPYITNPIKFAGKYNQEVIFNDFPYYLKTWGSIVSNNLGLTVEAYLDQTSLLWQINPPDDGYTSTFARNVYLYNDYGLKTDPLSNPVYRFINYGLGWVDNNLREVILRPATYTFLIILTGVAMALKNGPRSLLVILPVLLNTGTMFLAIPAQDFRYQLANVFIAFLMIAVVFLKFDTGKVRHE
ncbi:DUF6020 family protein [Halobacillus shinanisalinarum]|uniref:DUF6020 family protein n=1 Tax=Halobacillus shinanisalinarum TaxID=2932258 RepID=A0ABY4H1X3_9BACI|nr:DUF6020 family protein [Halobacillus shinanisalinarum]UOQ94437.1 DUF6020 family protein [Halobacillus shinanisalinarum]